MDPKEMLADTVCVVIVRQPPLPYGGDLQQELRYAMHVVSTRNLVTRRDLRLLSPHPRQAQVTVLATGLGRPQ